MRIAKCFGSNWVFMAMAMLALGAAAKADTFGTGANQFTLDFVPISGATNPTSGYGIVNHDYRMGTYEITNAQWDKFKAAYGTVTGNPPYAFDLNSYFTGASVPTNNVSWYEAAQFVNYLNTSTGHQAAYKFTGTQGTSNYTFATWSAAEAAGGTNLYRNKDAFYFLPTEDEWVKAAYWNGTYLRNYATKAGDTLTQGNGTSGTGWNYGTTAISPSGPWAVGSGSQELNGTYDMMGNVSEWMESPYSDTNYGTGSSRGLRGGAYPFYFSLPYLGSTTRDLDGPSYEQSYVGFRVASVPEPSTIALMLTATLGGLLWWRRRR